MAADGEIVGWCFFGLVIAILFLLAYKYRLIQKILSWWHKRGDNAGEEEGFELTEFVPKNMAQSTPITDGEVFDVYGDTALVETMKDENQPDEQKPSLLNRFTSSWNKFWGKK